MIESVLSETLKRTLGIGIVVVGLLFLVEFFNHYYGDKLLKFFESRQKFLPFWGALLALLPGCNLSAAVAILYLKRMVSIGTLVAAMIATADESIYVFLPARFNFLPLFAVKFVLAVVTGSVVDFIIRKRDKAGAASVLLPEYCCSIHEHHHDVWGMLRHSLRHSAKVVLYIFIVLFGFNLLKDYYGFENISRAVLATGPWQPFVAGLVGLVPGCGTSVVIATLYVQKILTFGGAVAGLSVAAGDTVLVLMANKLKIKELVKILAITFTAAVVAGQIIQLFY